MADDNKQDPYNKGGFIAFIFSVVFSLVFFVYVALIYDGIKIDEIVEEKSGEAPQTVAFDPAAVEKPWVESSELVEHGKKVYSMNCAVCHGANGAGDGPGGAALNPKPRDLIKGEWTKGGDSISLYKTIKDGISGTSMAPFGHLAKNDRWALVHYIHSITKNRIEDDSAKVEEFGKTAE